MDNVASPTKTANKVLGKCITSEDILGLRRIVDILDNFKGNRRRKRKGVK